MARRSAQARKVADAVDKILESKKPKRKRGSDEYLNLFNTGVYVDKHEFDTLRHRLTKKAIKSIIHSLFR
jgi:hypothetical protein